MEDSTQVRRTKQALPPPLLIGESRPALGTIEQCNHATTLTAWSFALHCSVIMAVTCKRWQCRFCGPQRVRKLASITQAAKPNRFITLTVNNAMHTDPKTAWQTVQPKTSKLVEKIRRKFGKFEYLRVLEVTAKGWPHWHMIARCEFIPQAWLSNAWNEMTGAPIVDIRKIGRTEDAYWYTVKYLAKQKYIQWTDRRVAMSKGFQTEKAPKPKGVLQLDDVHRDMLHPLDYIRFNLAGQTLYSLSPICWTLSDPSSIEPPQDEGDF